MLQNQSAIFETISIKFRSPLETHLTRSKGSRAPGEIIHGSPRFRHAPQNLPLTTPAYRFRPSLFVSSSRILFFIVSPSIVSFSVVFLSHVFFAFTSSAMTVSASREAPTHFEWLRL